MAVLSEPETILAQQVSEVMEALPAIRQWLDRSAPPRDGREHRPPLPASHIRVLFYLLQRGSMPIGQLARGLGISYSTATERIEDLESLERVVKKRSSTDNRKVIVSITPEASDIVSQAVAQRKSTIETALKRLSPRERQVFVKGLALLAMDLEKQVDGTALSLVESLSEK